MTSARVLLERAKQDFARFGRQFRPGRFDLARVDRNQAVDRVDGQATGTRRSARWRARLRPGANSPCPAARAGETTGTTVPRKFAKPIRLAGLCGRRATGGTANDFGDVLGWQGVTAAVDPEGQKAPLGAGPDLGRSWRWEGAGPAQPFASFNSSASEAISSIAAARSSAPLACCADAVAACAAAALASSAAAAIWRAPVAVSAGRRAFLRRPEGSRCSRRSARRPQLHGGERAGDRGVLSRLASMRPMLCSRSRRTVAI